MNPETMVTLHSWVELVDGVGPVRVQESGGDHLLVVTLLLAPDVDSGLATESTPFIRRLAEQRPEDFARLHHEDSFSYSFRPLHRRQLPNLIDASDQREILLSRAEMEELLLPLLVRPDRPGALKPFQSSGVDWLLSGSDRLLADDMGLGKTLQAVAAVQEAVANGTVRDVLVVAPKTLLVNWKREFSRWTPLLHVVPFTPIAALRDEGWRALRGRAHVIITNYEQLRSAPKACMERPWDLVIADEAHRLRKLSETASTFKRLERARTWLLTGTPVERDAEDLANLLTVLSPSRFSPRDARDAAALRARSAQYLLRRRKEDVLRELPSAHEAIEYLALTTAQAASYRAAGLTHRGDRGVLSLFNELRDLCDFDPLTGESSKLDRAEELVASIVAEGDKCLIFSYRLEPLRLLAERLRDLQVPTLTVTGELSTTEREQRVRRFQDAKDVPVMLASSRAAGEGLTLTAANHVIFINEWWNPSQNAQARDRVLRIGQEKPVVITKLRARGTIEERLGELLIGKERLSERLIEVATRAEMRVAKTHKTTA